LLAPPTLPHHAGPRLRVFRSRAPYPAYICGIPVVCTGTTVLTVSTVPTPTPTHTARLEDELHSAQQRFQEEQARNVQASRTVALLKGLYLACTATHELLLAAAAAPTNADSSVRSDPPLLSSSSTANNNTTSSSNGGGAGGGTIPSATTSSSLLLPLPAETLRALDQQAQALLHDLLCGNFSGGAAAAAAHPPSSGVATTAAHSAAPFGPPSSSDSRQQQQQQQPQEAGRDLVVRGNAVGAPPSALLQS